MNWDYLAFSKINGLAGSSRALDLAMIAIAKYGVLFFGLILVYLWFATGPERRRTDRKTVFRAVLAALLALGINQVIGLFYFRPRPFSSHRVTLLLDRSPDPSFPSDHATGSGALTFGVAARRPLIGGVMAGFTLLLIFSRVYVGTHYPLDVLGGLATGYVGSFIVNKSWPFIEDWADWVLDLWDRAAGSFRR